MQVGVIEVAMCKLGTVELAIWRSKIGKISINGSESVALLVANVTMTPVSKRKTKMFWALLPCNQ